jgi:DNA-binding FrmR family transcriptional regulator
MKFFRTKRDDFLDKAISEVRGDEPDAKALSAAADRVWQRVRAAEGELAATNGLQVIRGCADIRALLPAYHQHELAAARALIVEDHLRECVSCRSFVYGREVDGATAVRWQMEPRARGFQWQFGKVAFVAAAAVVLIAAGWLGYGWYTAGPAGSRAQIASLQGEAYAVSPSGVRVLRKGDQVAQGEFVRTAAGAHANLRLYDGSLVEMNQRAEFAVSATRRDTTIRLDQGSIIVHAAKRKTGHLYVSAPDCNVAVTGTLFAVNSGTKGSRISVIEGEVHVKHSGAESILHSGDQVVTTTALAKVPVSDEIGWSDDLDHELALLKEFQTLREKLEQIPTPAPRYASNILPLLPSDTVVYIGIPNLGDALQQANQVFQQELAQSPTLQQWWNQNGHATQHPTPEELITKIQSLSQYLGNEVVITMSGGPASHECIPVLLAEVQQPGLENFLQNQIAGTVASQKGAPDMHIVDPQSLSSLADNSGGMIMLVRQNMLVVGGTAASVRRMNAQLEAGANGFAATDFGQRILNVYSQGAQTLVAVNFGEIISSMSDQHDSQFFQKSGFNNVKYLIATRGDSPNHGDNRITIEFNGARQGLASWLAAPSPMGSLDYVSSNAGAALSFVGKQPTAMIDDISNMFGSNPDFTKALAEGNSELGMDIRDDIAGSLGGEVTIALDGPVLPTPSWKMIVEVNSASGFQLAIEKIVQALNREAQKSNEPGLALDQQQVGGRTFYTLHASAPGIATEYDYTFADGYMIMAPSRALVLAALETHANGTSLALSPSFRAILPSDNQANFSAMLYQNLSPILKPLASQLTSNQLAMLQQLAVGSKPSVMCAYGETDRIEVASSGKLLDLDPTIMALFHLLGASEHGTSSRGKS